MVSTHSAEWKLIQKIDLVPYFNTSDQLHEAWKRLNNNCNAVEGACVRMAALQDQLMGSTNDAERLVDLIRGHRNRNQKRALISLIGHIQRVLFGTLDENDLEQIKEMLEITANDTRKIASLLANQTEIVITEFNNSKIEIKKLHKHLEALEDSRNKLILGQLMNTALDTFAQEVAQFETTTNTLTNAILFATRGAVHPHFVDPNVFLNSLKTVKNSLPEVVFPLKESDPIFALFDIANIRIMFTNGHLVYQISIPLLDQQSYDLFRA